MTDDIINENTTDQQRENTALLAFNSFLGLLFRNEDLFSEILCIIVDVDRGTSVPDTGKVNDAFIAAWREHGGK